MSNKNYIKNKGIFVGTFNEADIANDFDKKKIEEMKQKTGLNYTNTEIAKKGKKIVGIRIYVCNEDDFKL